MRLLSLGIALACRAALAQDAVQPPEFEVATVKLAAPNQNGMGMNGTRNSLILWNNDLRHAVLFAYGLQEYQLSGGPKWVSSETFDITGRVDESTAKLPPATKQDRMRAMLRTLLVERFQLILRREMKPVPAYALIVAKSGFKLERVNPDGAVSGTTLGAAVLKANASTVGQFATLLATSLGRPVADQTKIEGLYNFRLQFAPANAEPDNVAPSIFTALEEQCGLKLEKATAPGETFVIERAERPSPN